MVEPVRLTIELDPQLSGELETLALSDGQTITELCIKAIRAYIFRKVNASLFEDPLEELWDNEDDAIYDNL